MQKSFFICILFCIVISIEGRSQSSTQQANSPVVYHPASEDKESWQRLNLWLSSTFILAVKEGQIDLDSCLYTASRSLGLSRYSILAEGIDDHELPAQSQWIDRRQPEEGFNLLAQSKGKKHLQLLILLGSYYAFQPGSYFLYRDSVEHYLSKAVNESTVLKEERLGRLALCLLGKIYVQVNNTKGDSIYKRLINQCREAGDKETEARAFAYRGIYTAPMPTTFQQKIADLQKATELYHNLNNAEGEINTLTDIGYLLVVSGQLQPANEVLLRAFQLAEAIHYPYTHYNTDALAMVTVFKGEFGEPLKYARQTIKIAEDNRDSIGWAYFYSRLYLLYKTEGEKEKECEDLWHKAWDRFVRDGDAALYNHFVDEINHMNSQGRGVEALKLITDIAKKVPPLSFSEWYSYHMALAICYSGLRQFDLAKMHLSKADSMETKAEGIRGPLRRSYIYSQYGFINYNQGKYREAKKYFEKYLSASPARDLRNDLQIHRSLIKIDSALHDNSAGLVHYRKYTQLLDSNFRVSKIRQAEELDVVYQTKEKENQIASLNQQSKLEKANLKQATLVKNLTIAGIVAVLIIAALLYRQSRLRKRNNNVVTHKNEQLQHLLTEKEWLLKEIHHRVKNNLQIVMSLLNSQSAYIDNESALTAIHDSQHRVHAMSLIHQKLYSSENVSSIDMTNYIRELASYLGESFNTGQRIRFEFDIEPLEMDVSQAVPLGLILNEAITNSIKYAFPNDRSGRISISLSNTHEQQYLLVISDNGVGMPGEYNNKKSGSLGLSLMKGLSEDLDGNFSIENNNGTIITISFVHEIGVKKLDTFAASFISNN